MGATGTYNKSGFEVLVAVAKRKGADMAFNGFNPKVLEECDVLVFEAILQQPMVEIKAFLVNGFGVPFYRNAFLIGVKIRA